MVVQLICSVFISALPEMHCSLIATHLKSLQFIILFPTAYLWYSPFSLYKGKEITENAQLEKISQKGTIL